MKAYGRLRFMRTEGLAIGFPALGRFSTVSSFKRCCYPVRRFVAEKDWFQRISFGGHNGFAANLLSTAKKTAFNTWASIKIPKLLLHRLFLKVRYFLWIDGKLELVVDPYQILERNGS
ncbi:hypothetical protein SUGI_0189500 [Cryptomeria japonica]|nr:hypothetical protein SUGI_0189500 [Cryptomeria japonica]